MPTSSSDPTRPWIDTVPCVGSVIRERIFSSVLLPAPLRPMMPTTSPARTSKLMSRIAQSCSSAEPRLRPRNMRKGAAAIDASESRSVLYFSMR